MDHFCTPSCICRCPCQVVLALCHQTALPEPRSVSWFGISVEIEEINQREHWLIVYSQSITDNHVLTS